MAQTFMLMKLGLSRVFAAEGFNLTPEHWHVLRVLWEQGELTQIQVAKLCFKDRPNTTRIIDILEHNGFAERLADPHDRRRYRIRLTAAGKAAQQKMSPLVIGFLQRALQGISDDELKLFLRVNRQIIANLAHVERQ